MTALSRTITIAIVSEFGQRGFLRRLSDPYWFQALGCVLAFDWHSSGLTTTVTGALKEGIRGMEGDLGIFIAGGKGATSRKTPQHIELYAWRHSINPYPLIYASRMSAKVDNTAVQDGYQLYHHVFLFTHKGEWAVIQQGMNEDKRSARRYHWLGEDVRDFVVEPHKAVCCDKREQVLNMVASESEVAREVSTSLSKEKPERVIAEINRVKNIELTGRHNVTISDIDPKRLYRILTRTYERQPEDFERLLSIDGVGPKTIRALSLVSELIYGKPPSYRDPARFSFAHGGKDGTPFPVDRATYDKTIDVMKKAIQSAKVGNQEKMRAIRRLAEYYHGS
ncbi:MAG: DUF763 domain-containing protein [Thermodesulfovibrionales bacterium]